MRLSNLGMLVCLSTCLSLSVADSAFADTGCEVVRESSAVVLMTCPDQSDVAIWQEAGKSACGIRTFCNAWIWLSADDVPAVAPEKDAGLPRELTARAAAVWANDSGTLLKISKVR